VILSGVGGDELFGGYRRYLGDAIGGYYRRLPAVVRRTWLPALLSRLPQDRHAAFDNYVRYASAFVKAADLDPAERYMSYVTLCSPEVRAALLRSGVDDTAVSPTLQHYFARSAGAGDLDRIFYVDLKTSLPDDLLLLTDKASMAASIECRAPFIDHELVELTSRMPADLKVRGFTLKYLLKKAVSPWLPKEILTRKKRGFGAPVGAWLRRDLEPLVEDTLSERQVTQRGLFAWPAVRNLIEQHRTRRADHTDHLLGLVNLELWCRIFLDRHPREFAAGLGGR
jgi:asparagine synthase (glutamine-hydrolysing)